MFFFFSMNNCHQYDQVHILLLCSHHKPAHKEALVYLGTDQGRTGRSVLPCQGGQEAHVPAFPVITGRKEPLPQKRYVCVFAPVCVSAPIYNQ